MNNVSKITTDGLSLYAHSNIFKSMSNTHIYISYSNYCLLKYKIRDILDTSKDNNEKEIYIMILGDLIKFIKKYDKVLAEDYIQSEPLPFIEEKESYIVVQKDTKNVTLALKDIPYGEFSEEENDTIYTALIESTEILSANNYLIDRMLEFEVPILGINLNKK